MLVFQLEGLIRKYDYDTAINLVQSNELYPIAIMTYGMRKKKQLT